MALVKNNIDNKSQDKEVLDVNGLGLSVTRVHVFDEHTIGFALQGRGIYLNNLTLREDKNGNPFIAYPSRQGKDGKWYSHFTLYLSDADRKMIIDTVCRLAADKSYGA